MKTIITAKAPTVYQLDSLISFKMGYEKRLDGSFEASKEFYSENEAKLYLERRAADYAIDENQHSEMIDDISRGHLTFGTVTASIESVEE
jgi:hypothetical protein